MSEKNKQNPENKIIKKSANTFEKYCIKNAYYSA